MRPGMTMRLSLIISFLLHLFIVLAFQKAFPWHRPTEELRTYRVELIRPPVEDIDTEDLSQTDLEQIKGKTPPPEDAQDTISLDTEDVRYVSYARLVKEKIMGQWRYPPEARENLIEGRLLLIFSLSRSGSMLGTRVMETSGYALLDEEALRAVTMAAPFPPFPDHITVTRLNIKANFDYRIASRR